jgi:hypothetical protein
VGTAAMLAVFPAFDLIAVRAEDLVEVADGAVVVRGDDGFVPDPARGLAPVSLPDPELVAVAINVVELERPDVAEPASYALVPQVTQTHPPSGCHAPPPGSEFGDSTTTGYVFAAPPPEESWNITRKSNPGR